MNDMKTRWVKRGLKIVAMAIVAATVLGFIVQSLWNWLGPVVFGARAITFWQAVGILILSKILFGGFRGRPGYGGHWRQRMRDRWEKMTPEERERFRQGAFGACGGARGIASESRQPRQV
jgi:chromate transport protein ChrA